MGKTEDSAPPPSSQAQGRATPSIVRKALSESASWRATRFTGEFAAICKAEYPDMAHEMYSKRQIAERDSHRIRDVFVLECKY